MSRGKKYSFVSLSIMVVLLAGLLIFRDEITDWIKLQGYDPEPSIVALADNTSMVNSSRRLFYVNRPVIADRELFNSSCRENEHTIVLGCYLSGQRGIYLLDISDERLAGIKEVTAAHELLHAAYERLSSSERKRVDTLLTQAFINLDSSRIKETIEIYKKQDPSIVSNELHSILGTEVRDLPQELEEYYKRYFSDRKKIITYSEQYEQAFIERRNLVREFDIELDELKQDIESLKSELATIDQELKDMRAQMNQHKSAGRVSEYNAMVPAYNATVNGYNRDVDTISGLVVQYNDAVRERNSVVSEEAELIKAIDSREFVPEQR